MSDKWLNDIRERMHSYEEDAPKGLWESLEREMSAQHVLRPKRRAAVFLMWSKRVACVAAVVCACAVVGQWYFSGDSVQEKNMAGRVMNDEPATNAQPQRNIVLAEGDASPKPNAQPSAHSLSVRLQDVQTSSPSVVKEDIAPLLSENNEEKRSNLPASEKKDSSRVLSPSQSRNLAEHSPVEDLPVYEPKDFKSSSEKSTAKNERLFALNVFSSGGLGSQLRNASGDGGNYMVMAPGASAEEDSLVFGVAAGNEKQNVETTVHHRQPVRFGLTFSYVLSQRIALETGLTYTRLTSDMREGTVSFYYTGEQTLHYIGVPVNVKCELVHKGGFSLYGTAGLLTEKRIYGQLQKNYVIDAEPHRQEKETISSKPWQFSMNAAAGVQYKFVKCAALYAEPGISYYFNDGSSVKTIYKQKPLNFNFNLGLRFILEK